MPLDRPSTESQRSQKPLIRRKPLQAAGPTARPGAKTSPAGSLQRALNDPASAAPADVLALQRVAGNRAVQRLVSGAAPTSIQRETSQDETEEVAQRASDPGMTRGGAVGQQTEAAIHQARGGGSTLPDGVRAPMEQAFGADFGSVRVHTGSKSDQLNRSMSAKAFTVGSDIFFRQGDYNPGSTDGDELIAHELTHVVQQGGGAGTAQRKLTVGPAGDQYEQEADRVASQVMRRSAAPEISRRGGAIQRQEQQIGENGPRIKNEDFEYEIIGHRLAYRKDTTGAEDWLDRIGYQRQFAGEATGFGFRVVLLLPKEGSGRTPILAFKGSNKLPDFIVDADPIAVGFMAFKHNQDKVKALINQAGGRVDVTGHSLGGALAQHCASAFPGNVRRVVTFQAPGITLIQAKLFENLGDAKPEVTHHVAMGDVVDMAGGAGHLSGTSFVHGTRAKGLGGIGKGHTGYLLNTEALREQREGAGITPELLESLGLTGSKMTNATGEVEQGTQNPFWARGAGIEAGRTIGGMALGVGSIYGLIAGAGLAGKGIWKGMKAAGKGIWGGMKAAGKGIWGGMKAAGRGIAAGGRAVGRGIAAGGQAAWGGMQTVGRGIGNAAMYLGSQFAGFFRKNEA
jgi:pimeloyl-ACP methyl ester carboxylesterase